MDQSRRTSSSSPLSVLSAPATRKRLLPPLAAIVFVAVGALVQAAAQEAAAQPVPARSDPGSIPFRFAEIATPASDMDRVFLHTQAWLVDDFAAMHTFRPGYAFWRHIFTIPDGSIAYGSAQDGRLLAVFPERGDWTRAGRWEEIVLAPVLDGQRLQNGLTQRRDQVALLMEPLAGPVLHNPTRGRFLLPNARRYGSFLSEWGAIYERFGVPAEIGLAQAILESGLHPTIRSPARAIGFCQWLEGNWNRIKRLSPTVIEGHNQTTQAPYCAAYLAILTTKYGSFIPALSEHHAGGTNVGRTVIKGGWLGGADIRERYFLGAELAIDLREMAPRTYSDLYRTYGPRSFRYAEMVFGNTINVIDLREQFPQARIHAMRAPRNIPLTEVTQRTGLSADEVRRYNPALIRQVPAGANLYLPMRVEQFGPDVSFWHRPAPPAFAEVLHEFVRIDATLEEWDDPAFERVLRDFQRRFQATNTEEGSIMATMLAYVAEEMYRSSRPVMLREYRTSAQIFRLFEQATVERDRFRVPVAVAR